jgi:uncharacterized protein (TIGR02246 family)
LGARYHQHAGAPCELRRGGAVILYCPLVPARSPSELPAAFADAVNRGDLDAAVDLWSPDAVMVSASGEPIEGLGAVRGALQALIGSGVKIRIEVASMHASAGVALASGTLTITSPDGFSQSSDSVVAYERGEDGGWRIAIDAPWGLPGL